jgi:hypothetical protein
MSANSRDSLHTGQTSTGAVVTGFCGGVLGGEGGGWPRMRPSILPSLDAMMS